MAMSMFGSLLVFLSVGTTGSTDLVSVIDAQSYFKSRDIEVKPEKMLELAGKTPTDAKEEIAQLLAIRWLGEHPGEVKKTKARKVRKARDLPAIMPASPWPGSTAK
jgi:hypothetical protein